jgi:hypothetical protein
VPAGRHQARVALNDPRVLPVREARPAKRVGVERPQAARRRRLAGARGLDLDNLGEAVVAEGAAVPSRAAQDAFWALVKIEAQVRSAVLAARIARRKVVAVKFDDVVGVARVLLGATSGLKALGRKSFGQNLPSGCGISHPNPASGGSLKSKLGSSENSRVAR